MKKNENQAKRKEKKMESEEGMRKSGRGLFC
jgi:hypothetical protein